MHRLPAQLHHHLLQRGQDLDLEADLVEDSEEASVEEGVVVHEAEVDHLEEDQVME